MSLSNRPYIGGFVNPLRQDLVDKIKSGLKEKSIEHEDFPNKSVFGIEYQREKLIREIYPSRSRKSLVRSKSSSV